jgi:hypothetical protein
MEGSFDDFEVVTFLNNDVFLLTLPDNSEVGGPYKFDVHTVMKMVTKDFLVTSIVFSGNLLPQGVFIFEIGQRVRTMQDARRLDPKAPYCPDVYLYTSQTREEIPEAVMRRFASFCSFLQCSNGLFKSIKGRFEQFEDTSWDLSTL